MIKEENEVLEAALLAPETVTGNFLTANTSAISLFNKRMGVGEIKNQASGVQGLGSIWHTTLWSYVRCVCLFKIM